MANPEAWKRYRKANVKQISLAINRNTDADILAHLEKQPNRSEYVKRLIREDIARNG